MGVTAFNPRPYQELIRDHIVDNARCAVFADLGMGKTAGTLSAIELLWLLGSNYWPALIIAPLRVARGTWPREVASWRDFAHLKVSAITGTEPERLTALKRRADIYTINFENLIWLADVLGDKWPFQIVVVDESTRLAGFRLRKGTKRAKVLASVAKKTGRFIELTGTPAIGGLEKLWGQLWFLDYGQRLGRTYGEFKSRWFDEDVYAHTLTAKHFALDQISESISDICLTVRAKDYFDIKEPLRFKIEIDLPPKAEALYTQLEKEMYAELDARTHVDVLTAAHLSSKCLQLASGALIAKETDTYKKAVTEIHEAKLDALESLVEECSGAPLLVGYWWQHDQARILKRFPQARAIVTQQDEDDWNAGKIPLAPAHYASLGHGLNLQHGGHRFVHFSRWWDREIDSQLRGRIGPVRQLQSGYNRPVYEYEIIARGTVDELVSYRHISSFEIHELLLKRLQENAK